MKTTAVIAEYNPFHNGHFYQLNKIKETADSDFIIVIMSGEFTQRGLPAICDKKIRTRIALEHGADLVIELPVIFSTGSAQIFALGAINILNYLNCVDYLVYGTEQIEDYTVFKKLVSLLYNEPDDFKVSLKANISNGLSYPAAIEKAALSCMDIFENTADFKNLFLPNNMLATEYEKQLLKLNSAIVSKPLYRIGNGFSDTGLDSEFVSATALRKHLKENKLYNLENYMPESAACMMNDYFSRYCPVFEDDFSYMLYSAILSNFSDSAKKPLPYNYTDYNADNFFIDCNDSLNNKIKKNIDEFYSFSQFTSLLKSKDFTYNRISRSLCHIMLNLRNDSLTLVKNTNDCFYARILGFNKKAAPLLKEIKSNSQIPIISKTADASEILSPDALKIFNQTIDAANLYHGICRIKSNRKTYNEYQFSPVII